MRESASAREWKSHWPLVMAATIGFSFNSLVTYALGLFMDPLGHEFGWKRAQVSAGLTLVSLIAVPLAPAVGWMIDKWGARRMAIPGLILAGASLASFALANGSFVQWMALWVIFALVEMLIKSTVWTTAVSSVFTAGRGLAIGITVAGAGIAQAVTPKLTQVLIDNFGWRMAFVSLGAGWGGLALLLVLFFLYDARDQDRRDEVSPEVAKAAAAALRGLTLGQAVRDTRLVRIAISTFISMLIGIAILAHQVPILTDIGVSRGTAAYIAGLSGIASISGKVITGWMMDRWDAGWIGTLCLSVSAVAYAMLLIPGGSLAIIIPAIFIIGYTTGTKLQICAYFTSCYGGVRNFGTLFGVMGSIVALGSGLGPLMAGSIYDHTGGYSLLLIVGIPLSLLSGLLIFRLGPFPDWSNPATAAEAQPPSGSDLAAAAHP